LTAGDLRVAPTTKLVCKLALFGASRAGRQAIDAADLFRALFEDARGLAASIVRRHGVEPEVVVSALHTRMRERELREEQFNDAARRASSCVPSPHTEEALALFESSSVARRSLVVHAKQQHLLAVVTYPHRRLTGYRNVKFALRALFAAERAALW